ncbi:MAG: transposase [Acidobacteria bacterium]|nr:transposase [Acidobacteriota bacterium]MCA1636810.1 transposase [Acidobacteriota bacterium]
MKTMTESKALSKLNKLKSKYREFVKTNYEYKAQDCQTCPTKGACCLDAHFVNVHITKLEAVAIRQTLEKLSVEKQIEIYKRTKETVAKYDLKTDGDTFAKTFACPLFEKGVGCLVHKDAKPAPCISHACYENREDLPPDELQEEIENQIERLNKKTYRYAWTRLSLPVYLVLLNPFAKNSESK